MLPDPRLLGLPAASVAVSAVLLFTPLAGRAWLVLVWGVLVSVGTAAWMQKRPPTSSAEPTQPRRGRAPDRTLTADELVRPTEEALRKLHNPVALDACGLAGHLPWTLNALTDAQGDVLHRSGHPLRTALVQAIERLKPTDGAAAVDQATYHAILYHEYVLGHSTARIMAQYAISESTFHRYRRDAIRALAHDLAMHEEALVRARP